jgi:3-deoxy-manno-octulosonate cytidylyltransferase (CMP-KDO synthetase)
MLERVYRRVLRSSLVTRVAIATDDERILRAAEGFQAEAYMTDPNHVSGTDRVAEVAARFPHFDIVVNVQGDEPFVEPEAIDQAISPLLERCLAPVSTLKTALRSAEQATDPNVVKVVTDPAGRALYFSRARIPFQRDASPGHTVACFKHLGLYVYDRAFLLRFPALPRGPLELAENLEQLRVLENGYVIQVVETRHDSVGVDTEQDLAEARAQAAEEGYEVRDPRSGVTRTTNR